ncbi:MAG: HAMP domain-containing histidine kinase [Actinomycetota bacterium]|nr:HAMP domain-containing histidine kinase [Actinomycetota bacterium]
MNGARLRSLRNKLSLLFFAIVALALGLVFLFVLPQLRSNLEDQQLDDLERAARATGGQLERAQERAIPAAELDELVRAVADAAGAQVTLLGVQVGDDVLFYPISDSQAQRLEELPNEAAAEAFETRAPVRVTEEFNGVESAQVATPLPGERPWIAVYSRSLEDVADTVGLIRRRVLVAGAGALLIALLGGYLVAGRLGRRVQRLERAAEEVAAGRFVPPLPVDAEDELGQLTRAFNEMQGKLERVDRARREFIANASHELRTPIFSLGGFVELLRDEELDAYARAEFLQAVAEQVERLQKLATDLLDLSRLDAGSLDLTAENVDVAELADSVAREFVPALDAHGSRLALEIEAGRVEAVCDPDRVAQIMRILLDNALRHTPPGTDVEISAGRENGHVRIAVADSGPGLEENARRHAFERFFTADGASGSGLGLAIAKELAERMDGGITLTSRPGRTVFALELPVSAE